MSQLHPKCLKSRSQDWEIDHRARLARAYVVPIETVTFRSTALYSNASDPASDTAWAALMPVRLSSPSFPRSLLPLPLTNHPPQTGDGFITLPAPRPSTGHQGHATPLLPPGIPTPNSPHQQYDISVFHQLHCLSYIRTFLYSTVAIARKPDAATDAGERAFVRDVDPHVAHCFDYVRQGLMCAADMTVEWPRVEADGSRFAIDGWGVGHRCASWVSFSFFLFGGWRWVLIFPCVCASRRL